MTLKNTLQKLQTRLNNSSVYAVWVKFKAGDLEIDTSTEKNLFVSLENKKSGFRKANAFRMNIAYVPAATFTNNKFGDINYIDKCLFNNKDNKAVIQYGYDYAPDGLVSPKYELLITNYTKEFQNGFMIYTITGLSEAVKSTEELVTEGNITGAGNSKIRATEAAKYVLSKYVPNYKIDIDKSALGKDKEQDYIAGTSDTELFQYVTNILQSAIDIETEKTQFDKSAYYTYILDDVSKTIRIMRVSSDTSPIAEFTFNWVDKNNSLVINFMPQFDGIVLMTAGQSKTSVSLSESADIVKTSILKKSADVANVADYDKRVEASKWAEAIKNNPIKGTLVTVGIPYDIKLMTVVEVVPVIYGQKDMSAGKYFITSVTDNIDSGGYITTIEMSKII